MKRCTVCFGPVVFDPDPMAPDHYCCLHCGRGQSPVRRLPLVPADRHFDDLDYRKPGWLKPDDRRKGRKQNRRAS